MLSDLSPPQLALANYMSTLSEASYSASWMDGLEFALWRLVVDGPITFGQSALGSEHRQRLIELSDACGGWIIFHIDLDVTFIAMDERLQVVRHNP